MAVVWIATVPIVSISFVLDVETKSSEEQLVPGIISCDVYPHGFTLTDAKNPWPSMMPPEESAWDTMSNLGEFVTVGAWDFDGVCPVAFRPLLFGPWSTMDCVWCKNNTNQFIML